MTKKHQVLRLVIISTVTLGLAFIIREVYYFRTVFVNVDFAHVNQAELIEKSTIIVLGKVINKAGTMRFTQDWGDLMVQTKWRISVEEVLKGEATDTIIVMTDGGRYLLTKIDVDPTVQLTPNENVLLFLTKYANRDGYQVVGGFQGHFIITQGADNNEIAIQQETNETKTVDEIKTLIQQARSSI